MYIPVTYFGGVGGLIASGGVESTYITGSVRYKVHEFRGTNSTTTTDTFRILSGKSNQIDILVVGSGGGYGRINGTVPQEVFGGGGGGGGYIYSSSLFLQSGSFNISAGKSAYTTGSSGTNSFISGSQLYILATGGGQGGGWTGTGTTYTNGADGGSGGGAAGLNSSFGSGIAGQGFRGGAGTFNSSGGGYYQGGGGGGAGASGSTYFGGNGKINRILNGQTIWYAGGGAGGNLQPGIEDGSGSAFNPGRTPAGDYYVNVGAGGGSRASTTDYSLPGTVIIRYPYQNVELWKCNCIKFEQNTGGSTTSDSASISYVEGNTGNYYEGIQVPILTPQYRLIVSGSENQLRAYPLTFDGIWPIIETSSVALSFCL